MTATIFVCRQTFFLSPFPRLLAAKLDEMLLMLVVFCCLFFCLMMMVMIMAQS